MLSKKLMFLWVACAVLCSCGDSTWQELSVLEVGEDTVTAGVIVRIEPSAYQPVKLHGNQFTTKTFAFKGTLLNRSSDLDCVANITIFSKSGDMNISNTQSPGDTIRWAMTEVEKDLDIDFILMPDSRRYSGKGHFYFYLTDADKKCISNIVGWKVTFK